MVKIHLKNYFLLLSTITNKYKKNIDSKLFDDFKKYYPH